MNEDRVLLVGTFGGGGIHQYVDQQRRRLAEVETPVYDMHTDDDDDGDAGWFLAHFLLAVVAALRFPFRRRPDVVHVHTSHRFSFYRASFYVLFAAHVWRRPVVLHVHGSAFDEFLASASGPLRRFQDLVFAASDRIVVLSPYWREVFADRVADEKLVVLPNAVDPAEYDPSYGADPPRIVFVSNLVERKGVEELVTAVDRLQNRPGDVAVDVAGSGPLTPLAEELADRHEAVTYHGYVSEARKRELLSAGSIFVLPTYAENLPIAMLEGMAGGNAVVATGVGAIPDVIGSENGVLVDPGDADALADALADLADDSERVESMGRRNRALVCERYSWDVATDRLSELYDALTATPA